MRTMKVMTVVLFVLLVSIGVLIASQRPLWNDEYYSLVSSTHNISYVQILNGGVSEGNNSPLFYILQKIQCDACSYHLPQEWLDGHWGGQHRYERIFLRLQSIIVMSISLSALFYYFGRYYSPLTGFYALILALSSSEVWFHWVEARPYAWWFALSIFQMLFVLNEFRTEKNKNSWWLAFTHLLLALTVTISAIQIIAAGCVLWIWRKSSWKFNVAAILLPLGIILFYYLHAPKYAFFFVNGPISLINANFPKERLLVALIFLVVFVCCQRGNKKWMEEPQAGFLVFAGLMLGFFAVVLTKLKLMEAAPQHGFQISGRYFLSLVPLSIIATTIFSVYLMQAVKSKIWQAAVFVLLAAFLIFRVHLMLQSFSVQQILHLLGA